MSGQLFDDDAYGDPPPAEEEDRAPPVPTDHFTLMFGEKPTCIDTNSGRLARDVPCPLCGHGASRHRRAFTNPGCYECELTGARCQPPF